jgi:proliferating cell nuclear antigen
MQLNLEIKNVTDWKAILSAISNLSEDAMFLCNNEGISFRGMDKSHLAYLSVNIPNTSFEVYEFKTSFFVLPIKEFKNLFDSADNDSIVKLKIEKEDYITILIQGNFETRFEQRLITKEFGNIAIPKINAKSKFVLNPNTFMKIIEDLQKITKNITISTSTNSVKFSGNSEGGKCKIDLQSGTSSLEQLEIIENSSASYSLEYLDNILQSLSKISEKLTLEFGTRIPLHISFELTNKITADYFLSPRTD